MLERFTAFMHELVSSLFGPRSVLRYPNGNPTRPVPFSITRADIAAIEASTWYQSAFKRMVYRERQAGEFLIVAFQGNGSEAVLFRSGVGGIDYATAAHHFESNSRLYLRDDQRWYQIHGDHIPTTLYKAYWLAGEQCYILGEFIDWAVAHQLFMTASPRTAYMRHKRVNVFLPSWFPPGDWPRDPDPIAVTSMSRAMLKTSRAQLG